MANIKFSQFTEKTTLGTVDFLVGYTGAENVQISPTNLLSTFVSGSGTNGQVAYFDPSNNLTGENAFFWDYTNKRLGIGTISPTRTLHIATDSGVLIKGASGSANAKISLLPASGGRQYDLGNVGADFRIFDASAGVTRMYFDNDGNTGIGTTTPSSTLQISGTLNATGISQLGSGGSNVYLTSSSAGNVGIGTSSPTQKLDVNGAIITEDYRAASIFYLTSGDDWRFRSDTGSERMRITSGGNVGIGTSSPSFKLEVSGGGTKSPFYTSDGGRGFKMDSVSLVGTYSEGSDANGANDIGSNSNKWRDAYFSGQLNSATISTTGTATFAGTVLIDGVSNYTGLTVKGITSSRPAVNFTNATQGNLGTIFGTEARAISIGTGATGVIALTLDASQNATFAGDITTSGEIKIIDSSATGNPKLSFYQTTNERAYIQYVDSGEKLIIDSDSSLVLNTNNTARLTIDSNGDANFEGSATIRKSSLGGSTPMADGSLVLGAGSTDYYSFRLDSNADLYLDKNFSNTAANVLSIDRSSTNGNITFAGSVEMASGQITSDGSAAAGAYLELKHANNNSTDVCATINLTNNAGGYAAIVGGTAGANNTGYIEFKTDNAGTQGTVLTLNGDNSATFAGKVGVGIAATDHLEVAGNIRANVSNAGGFMLTGASASGLVRNSATGVALRTNTTDQLIIDNSGNATFAGNVTLSSTGPLLYLANTTSTTGKTWRFSSAANGKFFITQEGVVDAVTLDHTTGNANFAGYIYVNTGGAEPGASQVGVRITGTQGQAFWNSANSGTTGYNHFNFYNGNGAVGSIVTNGSATSFNTSSDYRLKEDLQDFAGLDMVSKISVYDFKWKADESRSYGVMAHELQEVLPQAVTEEKDAEEMQGVDYSKIVPLLVKSIQELKSEIEELKSK